MTPTSSPIFVRSVKRKITAPSMFIGFLLTACVFVRIEKISDDFNLNLANISIG